MRAAIYYFTSEPDMSMQSGCDEKEAFVMHFMDNNGKVGAFLKMYDI